MKNKIQFIPVLAILIILSFEVKAQQQAMIKDSLYIIELNDHTQLIGKLTDQNDSALKIETKNIGQITISKKKVKSYNMISSYSFHDNEYWFNNPNASRYFFMPSAINLKAGEGYYQNTYIFLNSFYTGITNNISIGGGFEFLTLFAAGDPFLYVTLKGGGKIHKGFNLAGGALYARIPGDGNSLGIFYSVTTLGNDENNFSAGVGFGNTSGKFSERPVFTFSAVGRASRKIAFVTENWIYPTTESQYTNSYPNEWSEKKIYDYVISYGFRIMGEKISIDIALVNNKDIADFDLIGIPMVNFVAKF